MFDDSGTQSQAFFSKVADDLQELQAVNRANENRIETTLVDVIEKCREYQFHNKQLIEANQLLKRAMRKFYKISNDEREKNLRLHHEIQALKVNHDTMQRKLAKVERKYQELHQKMSAVIRDAEKDEDDAEIMSSQIQ